MPSVALDIQPFCMRSASGKRRSVAGMLQNKQDANLQAAIVKDVGALFEQGLPDIARELFDCEPDPRSASAYAAVLANIVHQCFG